MEGLGMKGHDEIIGEVLRPDTEEYLEELNRMWEQMQKGIEDAEREDFEPALLFEYHVTLPKPMKSQVLMNKPTNIRARTSC
jgi:hypothetical protein